MSTLSLRQLLDSDPGAWHAATAAWKQLAQEIDDAAEQLIRSSRDLPQAWPQGRGSASAENRAALWRAELSNAYNPAKRVTEALDRHAYAVTDLRGQAMQVIASARQAGLTVDVDAMTITAPAAAYQGAALDQTARQISAHLADLEGLLERARGLDDLTAEFFRVNVPAPQGGFGGETTPDISQAEIVQQGAYDPARVRAWWDNLTPWQQEQAIRQYPGEVGWLDGIPAEDRDAANRLMLDRYRTDLTARQALLESRLYPGGPGTPALVASDPMYEEWTRQLTDVRTQLQGLDRVETKLGELGDKGMLLGLQLGGDGKSIIAVGNPDTAAHTAVWVPGLGTDVATDTGKDVTRVRDLQQAAAGRVADPDSVAAIMWLGYDAPELETSRLNLSVAGSERSVEGGAALDRFVDGLRATHTLDTPTHVTVEGHSYGSTVVAQATRHDNNGLAADDLITVGSPGVQADHVSELRTAAGHVWAGSADGDPVSGIVGHLPFVHGNEPTDEDFGANRFTTDTEGHSDYWRPGSDSLRNQAAIITGQYGAVNLMFGQAPAS